MQEFEAAKAAILQVHPDANVVGNRIDEYPITVTAVSYTHLTLPTICSV